MIFVDKSEAKWSLQEEIFFFVRCRTKTRSSNEARANGFLGSGFFDGTF